MGGSFDPVHDAHAIERVNATVALASPIEGSAWPRVFAALRDCAGQLELPKYYDGIEVSPGPALSEETPFPSLSMQLLNSSKFARVSEEGEIVSIQANRAAAQVQTRRYIRWGGYEEVLREVAQKVVAAYPQTARIDSIRLEYEDRFFEGNTALPRSPWNEVLIDGDLISVSHLRRPGPWHMFTGWFEEYPEIGRILIQLNVVSAKENGTNPETKRFVAVQCHTAVQGANLSAQDTEAIMRHLNWLHLRSKGVIRSILTGDMRKRISIDVDEQDE